MNELAGADIAAHVAGLVHEETQVEENALVLTVDMIERLTTGPSFDFGGGEYEGAEAATIEPEKRDPEDDYAWWNLDAGTYLVRCNESIAIPEGAQGIVQGWWRLTANGVLQPTQMINGEHEEFHQLLHVPEHGTSFKENARFAELRVVK